VEGTRSIAPEDVESETRTTRVLPSARPRQRAVRNGDCHAIVLAGGRGRRLEAVTSRFEGYPVPKQYVRFDGTSSLLQQTLQRIRNLMVVSRTHVVIDASHVTRACSQVEVSDRLRLVVQPGDRGTAAGVLLPLSTVLAEDPEAIVIVTPSDHGVTEEETYRVGISEALRAVGTGRTPIVLLGVEADSPSTDYGWIVPGEPTGTVRRVDGFVEKPAAGAALTLLAKGALWGTMVLVARAQALWSLFEARAPWLCRMFHVAAALGDRERERFLRRRYESLDPLDFSRDVLGAASSGLSVYTWPRQVGWTDLGTPERMYAWLGRTGSFADQRR